MSNLILKGRRFGGLNIKHRCRTVREFIDIELRRIEDRENKCFKISTKRPFNDMQNLVLFFEDGILKSNHTTGKKFDYNDVLDYEILEKYAMQYIESDDIESV